jgi:hypothetical protein
MCPSLGESVVLVQCMLFQVQVESLLQLIGLMDKHVLDSANLFINVVPVSAGIDLAYCSCCCGCYCW